VLNGRLRSIGSAVAAAGAIVAGLAADAGAQPAATGSGQAASTGSGQAYPVKPIRFIVAVPPGGPADTLSRLVGPRLTAALGQPVVIDNRPGANGNIAYEITAHAAPDGYTITSVAAGIAINPSLYRDVKFDPVKDYAPVTQAIAVPNILVVHPKVAAASVQELVALAKSRPGQLVFASAGNGTSGHLALEQFSIMSGVQVVHVPYKGGGPALTELIGGQVQALFSIALVAMPQVKAGRIRGLAITSSRRSTLVPDLPTVAESGFPGFECIGWFGVVAPAKTPRAVVALLHREITHALRQPEIAQRLQDQGADVIASSSAAFAAYIAAERLKWAGVIKQAGIKID
jgi:tripartite-type tricarboxylate transporter receptor subunit TctC